MAELWQKILQTGGVKIYGIVVGLATISITTRALGPEGRGELVVINTWVTAFYMILHLSLGQVAIHHGSKSENMNWFGKAYSTLLFYACVLTILGWLVAVGIFFNPFVDILGDVNPLFIIVGFLLLPCFLLEQYGTSLLTALEKLKIFNVSQVIGQTIGLFSILFLIYVYDCGIIGVLSATILSQVVILSRNYTILNRIAGGFTRIKNKTLRRYFSDGAKLHLNAISTFLIGGTDILMINHFCGKEDAAFYQVGVKVLSIIIILPQVATMVIYGRLTKLGPDEGWKIQRKIIIQVCFIVGLITAIAVFTSNIWVPILCGNEFLPMLSTIKFQLIASLFMSFSIMLGSQWICRGLFVTVSVLTTISGLLNVFGNYLLIPIYGIFGAILVTNITYGVGIIINLIMIKKYIKN